MQAMVRRVRRLVAVLALVALALPVRAAGVDPSADGPFAVGVTTLPFIDGSRSRTLVTEVWYPARSGGRDAPARRGRYPLVLVAHGHCGFRTNYEYLSVPLASWGFLVAAPDFPGINRADCDAGVPPGDLLGDPPRDLEFLRRAFHDRSGPARALARLVRGRRAGLVGHSLGGTAVVNASLADPDLTAAQLARQQALTRRYATAFLRRYLARDRRFARFLAPADAVAEGTDVELTARVRGAGSR